MALNPINNITKRELPKLCFTSTLDKNKVVGSLSPLTLDDLNASSYLGRDEGSQSTKSHLGAFEKENLKGDSSAREGNDTVAAQFISNSLQELIPKKRIKASRKSKKVEKRRSIVLPENFGKVDQSYLTQGKRKPHQLSGKETKVVFTPKYSTDKEKKSPHNTNNRQNSLGKRNKLSQSHIQLNLQVKKKNILSSLKERKTYLSAASDWGFKKWQLIRSTFQKITEINLREILFKSTDSKRSIAETKLSRLLEESAVLEKQLNSTKDLYVKHCFESVSEILKQADNSLLRKLYLESSSDEKLLFFIAFNRK